MRGNCNECPVASAIARAYKNTIASVGFIIVLYNEKLVLAKSWPLPDSVRDFIRSFDRGYSVEPFEFELTD